MSVERKSAVRMAEEHTGIEAGSQKNALGVFFPFDLIVAVGVMGIGIDAIFGKRIRANLKKRKEKREGN